MNCTRGCGKVCKNLTGLKKHLTQTHDGWTTEELEAAVKADALNAPQSPQPSQDEKEKFWDDDSIPLSESAPENPQREKRKSSKNAQVRLSKAMLRFKRQIAETLPLIYCRFVEGKMGVSGNLSSESAKTMSEMWEAYLDLLGFDVEVEPVQFKIGGKWLIFTWPLAMVAVTFFMLTDKRKVKTKTAAPATEPIYTPESPSPEERNDQAQ